MAKLLKLRRGTTSQHSSFTGAEGEVTVDTTKDTLVVHDGSTAGGTPLAKESGNIATATTATVGTNVTVTANNSTNETVYPVFVDGATGTQGIESDTGFTYNPSSGDLTIGGELDAATLDISGDADIDGTLEADAITVNGTALNTVIAGVTVTNATNCVTASSITVADESTDTICNILYTTSNAGNLAPKTGSNLTFNSNTGLLSTTAVTTTGNVTVGGNLQVDGTTTTVNSSTMTVTDKNIEIAKGAANDAAADGAGITVDSGDGDKTWNWVDATDAWTSSEHIHLGDSKKLLVGTGSDLQLYADGNNSLIDHNGDGSFYIRTIGTSESIFVQATGNATVKTGSSSKTAINCVGDGQVELYQNDTKVLETVNNGIKVVGTESDSAYIYISADEGDDNADQWRLLASSANPQLYIQNYKDGSWETSIQMDGGGATVLCHDDAGKLQTTATGVTITGAISDDLGNVRGIPATTKSSAHTLVAGDAGKVVYISTGGVTIPNSVMSGGDVVTIINNSGSDQTLTQDSGLTLYNTADAATGNRTLAGRGMCTVWFQGGSTAYISGAGLS